MNLSVYLSQKRMQRTAGRDGREQECQLSTDTVKLKICNVLYFKQENCILTVFSITTCKTRCQTWHFNLHVL